MPPADAPADVPFCALLAPARAAAGIPSAREAARRAGLHQPNYWALEHRVENPRWQTAVRVILSLGLPLETFFPAAAILAAADRLRYKSE